MLCRRASFLACAFLTLITLTSCTFGEDKPATPETSSILRGITYTGGSLGAQVGISGTLSVDAKGCVFVQPESGDPIYPAFPANRVKFGSDSIFYGKNADEEFKIGSKVLFGGPMAGDDIEYSAMDGCPSSGLPLTPP